MTTPAPTALVISTNYGTETDELVKTTQLLRDAGVTVTVAAVDASPIKTLVHDTEPGPEVTPDVTLDHVVADDFDALVIPGGTINADTLRTDAHALQLARDFAAAEKVIASICHGPWLLAEADLVDGKQLTSYASIRTDLVNAGATWSDREAEVDATGYTLITSRTPDDVPAFTAAIAAALSNR